MKFYKKHHFFAFLLVFGAIAATVKASPIQPLPHRHWDFVQGDNVVEASSQGIHINQRDSTDVTHFASATARLTVASANAWKVGFDVRFGTLRPAGAMVRLYKGDTVIGWAGADVWNKNLGIASGDRNFKLTIPADTQWHHIEFVSDGKTLSIFHNGQKIGEDVSQGAPDHIFVGSEPLSKGASAQQTEVSLRDVHEDIMYIAAPQVATTPNQAEANPPQTPQVIPEEKDTSTATLTETLEWVTKTLLKSGGSYYKTGTTFYSYVWCNYDLSDCTLSFQSHSRYGEVGLISIDETDVIPLKEMDAAQIRVEKADTTEDQNDYWHVRIIANDAVKAVSETFQIEGETGKKETRIDSIFDFQTEDVARRFAKALRHAIRLSKTRKINEPF